MRNNGAEEVRKEKWEIEETIMDYYIGWVTDGRIGGYVLGRSVLDIKERVKELGLRSVMQLSNRSVEEIHYELKWIFDPETGGFVTVTVTMSNLLDAMEIKKLREDTERPLTWWFKNQL